jgi:hypothetical protein
MGIDNEDLDCVDETDKDNDIVADAKTKRNEESL